MWHGDIVILWHGDVVTWWRWSAMQLLQIEFRRERQRTRAELFVEIHPNPSQREIKRDPLKMRFSNLKFKTCQRKFAQPPFFNWRHDQQGGEINPWPWLVLPPNSQNALNVGLLRSLPHSVFFQSHQFVRDTQPNQANGKQSRLFLDLSLCFSQFRFLLPSAGSAMHDACVDFQFSLKKKGKKEAENKRSIWRMQLLRRGTPWIRLHNTRFSQQNHLLNQIKN